MVPLGPKGREVLGRQPPTLPDPDLSVHLSFVSLLKYCRCALPTTPAPFRRSQTGTVPRPHSTPLQGSSPIRLSPRTSSSVRSPSDGIHPLSTPVGFAAHGQSRFHVSTPYPHSVVYSDLFTHPGGFETFGTVPRDRVSATSCIFLKLLSFEDQTLGSPLNPLVVRPTLKSVLLERRVKGASRVDEVPADWSPEREGGSTHNPPFPDGIPFLSGENRDRCWGRRGRTVGPRDGRERGPFFTSLGVRGEEGVSDSIRREGLRHSKGLVVVLSVCTPARSEVGGPRKRGWGPPRVKSIFGISLSPFAVGYNQRVRAGLESSIYVNDSGKVFNPLTPNPGNYGPDSVCPSRIWDRP